MIALARLARPLLAATLLLGSTAHAQDASPLQLDGPFGDHMVLQRDEPLVIRGEAPPDATVRARFGEDEASGRADAAGRWELRLPPRPASSAPGELVVEAVEGAERHAVRLEDVLVGDVWICTGQSNMRWRVSQSAEAEDVLEQADLPGLRLMDLEGTLHPDATRYERGFLEALTPGNFYRPSGWQRASAESAASFSAVAFAFGRRLGEELDVPIGLVHGAIGGAPMEAFIPRPMPDWMTSDAYPAWCRQRVRQNLAAWYEDPRGGQPHHPFEPGFLFAAGIEPWSRFPVRGVLWYQGESNATDTATSGARDAERNEALLREVVASFREAWDEPLLPFVFAQLPGIQRDWELFREVQERVARTTPRCEMAVTIDLGHPTDVHPRRKIPVGERLAHRALEAAHGRTDRPRAPRVAGHSFEGDEAVLRVEGARELRTIDHQLARGFEVAGEDRVFHPAVATLHGDRIRLAARAVAAPVAARYAFEDDPDTNVVNRAGLPLAPFRSDRWQDARRTRPAALESFEGAPAGPLGERTGPLGTWRAAAGHAEITSRFAHEGSRSLHVHGGADREVELEFGEAAPASIRMRAERWTRRPPFSFRVDAEVGGAWREVLDGDGVRVGARFLSEVSFDVPSGAKRLRLRCTSPENSGLLLDAISAEPRADMEIASCVRMPWHAPAMRGRFSVADRVRVEARGGLAALRIVACEVEIPAVTLPHLRGVRVLGAEREAATSLTIEVDRALAPGPNDVDLEVRWDREAPWDAARELRITGLHLSDGTVLRTEPNESRRPRLASVVRGAGEDGVHTTRIPGIVCTSSGVLVAVFDNRYRSSGDLPGDIDVGMSRSLDGGRTWEPMRVIMDMGDDPQWRHDGIGDPAILVDGATGRLWVAATWSHGDRSWNGSGPGMKPEETGQLMLVHSDDDGLSWSEPINITAQVKDPSWRFVLQGPGSGITMKDGTLVFAAQYRSAPDGPHGGKPFSTILWSRDRGVTWHLGAGVKVDTTEAQVVELEEGQLMLNCRDNRGGARSVYTSSDLGRTWDVHPTSRRALVEPVCMASLLRVDHGEHGRLLLFSNPATVGGRRDMTVKASLDDGASWPASMWTLHDQRPGFGYSCLVRIDADHVGVLYEGARELYFQRFGIDELLR